MKAQEMARKVKENEKLQGLTLIFPSARYNTVTVQGIDSPEAKAELEALGFECDGSGGGQWKKEAVDPRQKPSAATMDRIRELDRTRTGGPERR